MHIKENLLNLLGINPEENVNSAQLQDQFPVHFTDGLCIICENKGHCVWVENKKIHCEHYE